MKHLYDKIMSFKFTSLKKTNFYLFYNNFIETLLKFKDIFILLFFISNTILFFLTIKIYNDSNFIYEGFICSETNNTKKTNIPYEGNNNTFKLTGIPDVYIFIILFFQWLLFKLYEYLEPEYKINFLSNIKEPVFHYLLISTILLTVRLIYLYFPLILFKYIVPFLENKKLIKGTSKGKILFYIININYFVKKPESISSSDLNKNDEI